MADYQCPSCGETENLCFTDMFGNGSNVTAECRECGFKNTPELFALKIYRNQEAKADAGKLMLELIPPEALEALGRILTYGANKYGANKWQGIDDAKNRYKGALLRHYAEYCKDPQSRDSESGLLHIEHLLCNAMFLTVLEGQCR